jgi:SsrA-binding protein
VPTLAYNKRAKFDYDIGQTYEAGLVLSGQEVKSVKTGHVSLKGAFVTVKASGLKLPELYLINAHIPVYKHASKVDGYDPYRSRKLLLKKKEITYLIGKKQEQGLTLVPIKIYTKRSLLKLEFGIGKGRKKYDKRDVIKKRESDRTLKTLTKHRLQ